MKMREAQPSQEMNEHGKERESVFGPLRVTRL